MVIDMLPFDAGLMTIVSFAAAAAGAPSTPGEIDTVRPARAALVVHSRPDGRRVARIRARTPYGSASRLWVRARRGEWLKVAVADAPGGSGWIARRDTRRAGPLSHRVEIDRSARRLTVTGPDGRWSTRVVVGRPSSPTPLGTFQITDRLAGARFGGVYGARVLVLSAYGDWSRTSRVAIHGVPPAAARGSLSHGCIRVPGRALARLAREAPPGTPVRIRA